MQPTELIPQCFRQGAERMTSAFGELDQIIVAAHVNPDGDAAGAVAAACHVLRSMGKEIMAYAQPGLPGYLDFFPMPVVVHTTLEHPPFTPRCAVLLDCGEPDRLGRELAARLPGLVTVNIDHHLGGDGMGSAANWVEPRAAATAQLMAYVSLAAGLPLTGDLATAVALGIITDTGGFCHGNTSADVLYLTAHMVEHGCDIALLRERLENTWSRGRLTLWGQLLQRARLERGGSVCFCPVYLEDLRKCGALKEDLEGFVEQLRRLRGVHVAAVLREDSPGSCKFSLRSYGSVDVRAAAARLGGGGHRNAAGGTVRAPMDAASVQLLDAIAAELDDEGVA
ncbi:bifunctional oligoribonuclease/PAP phosphatase NrnA [Desulfovibrio desulfuricans]|uniref:DHH family phosphoesterase n=1 Tax=Desulfovibrio desulfuricans TaxID=876 RepID=UPI0035B0B443